MKKICFFTATALLVVAFILGPNTVTGVLQGQGIALVNSIWREGALLFQNTSGVTQFQISPSGPVRVKTYLQIQSMPTVAGEPGTLYNDGGTAKVSP